MTPPVRCEACGELCWVRDAVICPTCLETLPPVAQ